ncbi:N-6 DNA methylase [Bifidobacterium jacchi]|nr:N-6 DNA methylase [Bifidobacterium jacchi]
MPANEHAASTQTPFETDNLLTSADIARMAQVRPSAVSNWRSRDNKHFPQPVESRDGRPLFDYDEVATWLKANGIAFKDTRLEQAAWSFFDQWRGKSDPVTMASILLWAACLASTAQNSTAAKSDWGTLLNATGTASADEILTRCRNLTHSLIEHSAKIQEDNGKNSTLALALAEPKELKLLESTKLAELLTFVDTLVAKGKETTDRLCSLILETSIIRQGRMNGALGRPNSPASALLAKMAVSHLDAHIPGGKENVSVYDSACGILEDCLRFHEFSAESHHSRSTPAVTFHCADNDAEGAVIAARRFILADICNATAEIVVGDSLATDPYPFVRSDVVMLEPPFGLRFNPDNADARWRYGLPSRFDSSMMWVEDALAHLAQNGRAFVVTSAKPLCSPGESAIRRALIAAGCVEAIIALPAHLYIDTGIPTYLWVLSAPDKNRDTVTMISVGDGSSIYESEGEIPSWMRAPLQWFARNARSHAATPFAANALRDLHIVTRTVRSIDILGMEQVSLLPSDWLLHAQRDPKEIARMYQKTLDDIESSAEKALEAGQAIKEFTSQPMDYRDTNVLQLGDIATIRAGSAIVQGEKGADDGIITLRHVREGILPSTDPQAATPQDEKSNDRITEPGDILLTAIGEIRSMVDATGGHRVDRRVNIVRVDKQQWDSEYVALMLEGNWNTVFLQGSAIRHVRPARLEVPALPLEQQHRIAALTRAHLAFKMQTEALGRLLGMVADAARYGAAIGNVEESMTKEEHS